jgi:NAD(P)-dependent dehydrogenase (short-subunit alcohol dehydrogenase family)
VSRRAAIVTGASRGIGFAIAETLAELGYDLTLTARKPEPLAEAAGKLAGRGGDVDHLAVNMAAEDAADQIVSRHKDRFGRLDVLVNNAGVGIGAAATEHQSKFVDMQLGVNVRTIIYLYRAAIPLLREAAAEHRNAVVINMSSLAGKSGQGWLSVYSATKHAVIGYTEAMNKELSAEGIKSVAFCPGFVDTDMTEFVRGSVDPSEMIQPSDIGKAVRFVLDLSPNCVVPEIVFSRPGEIL